jgi:hypothetical protein
MKAWAQRQSQGLSLSLRFAFTSRMHYGASFNGRHLAQ